MAENIEKSMGTPEEEVPEIYTLTDENGVESDFELIAYAVINDNTYYAMVPVSSENKSGEDVFEEYVILKVVLDEDGEETLESIDDDEEFDMVADYFDDRFDEEFNYDEA
jgi:uncharacterized protein YrzB (UPF0473 family)